MGISSKKSTSTSNTNSTSTSTPNVPQWGVDSLQGLNDMIEKIAGTNAGDFSAPASALQTQAFTGAGNLGGWQSGNTAATDLATSVAGQGPNLTGPTSLVTPSSAASAGIFDNGISQYLNPELENVIKTSLADFDQGAGETRARQAAAGAGADAFGGSRWGIQEGETEGQLSRARGALDSGLRSKAYNDATALANEDANRRQSTGEFNAGAANTAAAENAAAQNRTGEFNAGEKDNAANRDTSIAALLGSLSNQAADNSRQDVATQETAGDTQRAIDQASRTAPISLAQTVAQLLQGNQLDLLTGKTINTVGTGTTTNTSNPSTFDQIGQGISTAAKLAALFG